MGLDAHVYCDCLEKGRIPQPMPNDAVVKIGADGFPLLERNGETVWDDFECEHESRRLIHHRLGNIALVALLRRELNREASSYPILLDKVVYNGIHAGDCIGLEQIPRLQIELQRLATFKCVGDTPNPFRWPRRLARVFPFNLWCRDYSTAEESDQFMQYFRGQMVELAETAVRVGKPISF